MRRSPDGWVGPGSRGVGIGAAMRFSHKREFLARQLRNAGVLRLLERAARRPCLLVVGYHRIGDRAGDGLGLYEGVYSASPAEFERQVRYLRDRFRLLGLDEVIERSADGFRVREPSALITFDDGYRDNYEAAFPILRDLGAPATFFLPTDFFERPRLFWWDRVALILDRTVRDRLTLDLPEPLEIDLRRAPRHEALRTVVRAFLAGRPEDEAHALDQLQERAGVEVDDAGLGRAVLMTWDQARALVASGMSIGSHAHRHLNLARLDEADQRDELVRSRAILERELGREVAALAYPYGVADAVSATTRRLAREAGYRVAFSFRGGVNRPGRTDPFGLARVNVGFADSAELFRARAVLATVFGSSIL